MHVAPVAAGPVSFGSGQPLAFILGPCVIESEAHALQIGAAIADIGTRVGVPVVFKASFDKANRTSISSYRGPGLQEGVRILAKVKATTGLPILTDIHEPSQAGAVAGVADILQIPAFLSRQTDLVKACAETGLPIVTPLPENRTVRLILRGRGSSADRFDRPAIGSLRSAQPSCLAAPWRPACLRVGGVPACASAACLPASAPCRPSAPSC